MIAFNKYFFSSSWKKIFLTTAAVNAFFSLLQILLILRINRFFGIPDILFAVGDNAIQNFVHGINYMPICIMVSIFVYFLNEMASIII